LEDASEKKFAGLLTYNVSSFTSQGAPLKPKDSTETSGGPAIAPQFAPMTRPVPAAAPQAAPAPVVRLQAPAAPPPPVPSTKPPAAAPSAVPPPLPGTPSSRRHSKGIFHTIVLKGAHGIGLDISKTSDGRTIVQRFKDMPDNAPNPALACDPPIAVGDLIVAVNDVACATFMDVVRNIKGSGERVKLTLERK
jgi:hypothetical protein